MTARLNIPELFQSLQSDLLELDGERIAVNKELTKYNLIMIPLVIGFIVGFIWSMSSDIEPLAYVFGFAAGVTYVGFAIVKIRIKKQFVETFKEKVIGRVISKIDPSFTFRPKKDLIFSSDKKNDPFVARLLDSRLFPPFSDCWVEDAVEGTVRDTLFHFAELHFHTDKKLVFTGIMMTAFLHNTFPSPVYIVPDSVKEKNAFLKLFSSDHPPGEIVPLAESKFENIFNVFAIDPAFAKAFLQPFIQERLVQMQEKIVATNSYKDSVRLALLDNTIVISIRLSVDLFEPNLKKSVNDITYLERNVKYLVLLLELLEDLNLNSK